MVTHTCLAELLMLERKPTPIDPTRGYVFLGMSAGGGGFFKKPPVQGALVRAGSAFNIEPNDFVYSRLFAWRGSFEIAGASEEGCVVSGEFPTFKVDHSRLDTRWLRYWFLSESGLREVDDRSAGSTSASRNRLREDRFLSIRVPLPSIGDQRRIAARLDEIVGLTSRVQERLDRVGRCLTASRANLVTRPHGDEGWRALPLREVLGLAIDAVPVDADTHYEMAGVYSFGRGLFRRSALLGSTTSYKTLHRLRAGQIVMSRLKAWEGAMALVDAPFEGSYLSPEFPTFDVNDDLLDDRFCEALLTSEPFWIRLKGSSKGIGARKERVNAERLLDVVVELPSLSQQRVIASQLDSLRRVEQLGSRRTRVVAALSRSVMNQEFSSIR